MADKEIKPDEKIVFGLAPTQTRVPGHREFQEGYVALLGVSDKAWDFMKDGMTHTLDLSSFGIPIQIVLFGCRTQQDAKDHMAEHNRKSGVATKHMPDDQDFGIKDGGNRPKKDLKGTTSLS